MGDAGGIESRTRELFAEYDEAGSPGGIVAVVREGRVVFWHGFGHASLEHRVPNGRDTVFYIASTSKQFVAASVAMLEVEGRLSLDDHIADHVPEMHRFSPDITVSHLLHHTSGLRDKYALAAIGGLPEEVVATDDGSLDLLSRQRDLNFTPGSRYMYSNSNYFLLAQIVERLSGQSLSDFTAERIFGPLGMEHTMFRADPTVVIPNRASGYRRGPDGTWHLAEYTLRSLGPGGVVTTVDDLACWCPLFFDADLPLGPDDLAERMLRTVPLTDGSPNNYAFGLTVDTYRGARMIGHAGGVAGFGADMIHFPDHGVSVMCLANANAVGAALKARQVADLWLGEALVADAATPPDATVSAASAGADDDPARFAGTYLASDETSVYRIELGGPALVLHAGAQRVPLTVVGPGTLQTTLGTLLDFEADGFVARSPAGTSGASARFSRVEAGAGQLVAGEYLGRYRSPELETTVEVEEHSGGLRLRWTRSMLPVLTPLGHDLFLASVPGGGEVPVRFVRGGEGERADGVTALLISIDRALANRFDRE